MDKDLHIQPVFHSEEMQCVEIKLDCLIYIVQIAFHQAQET